MEVFKVNEDGSFVVLFSPFGEKTPEGFTITKQGIESHLRPNSPFMLRAKRGVACSEFGHPRRNPYMTDLDYERRCLIVDENNVCCRFESIAVERYAIPIPERSLVGLHVVVRPCGPLGESFQRALADGIKFKFSPRVCIGGEYGEQAILTSLITFDVVAEYEKPLAVCSFIDPHQPQ